MAFATKIQGIPRDNAQPIWSMDNVSWWVERELRSDPRFRQVERDSGYHDHVAILTPREARELGDSFRAKGAKDHAIKLRQLDQRLALEAPESCWIVVSVYEWESGL